jgi:hypothetical protein
MLLPEIEEIRQLSHNSCKTCIYLIKVDAKAAPLSICINKFGSRGRLFAADLCRPCRNFFAKRIGRPKVIQPADGPFKYIPLTKGYIAIVDTADYEWLMQYRWTAQEKGGNVYASRHFNGTTMYMHREITGAPADKLVDHIDHNGINNRRCNLRVCSAAENIRNSVGRSSSSRYKGVVWDKRRMKWLASTTINGKCKFIGHFKSEIEAAKAYDETAKKLFGEYAYLNFPLPPR